MPHHIRRGKPALQIASPTPVALLRACPKCGAGLNQSCVRTITAKVCGKDVGGAYTKRLLNVHAERKAAS